MYDRDTSKDLVSSAISGAIGGGVVTSCAVFQGQPLIVAIPITALAALFAVICHKFDLV
jgi:MFS superfamily sulfate permease-like transporter